jgi:hypothetical protein
MFVARSRSRIISRPVCSRAGPGEPPAGQIFLLGRQRGRGTSNLLRCSRSCVLLHGCFQCLGMSSGPLLGASRRQRRGREEVGSLLWILGTGRWTIHMCRLGGDATLGLVWGQKPKPGDSTRRETRLATQPRSASRGGGKRSQCGVPGASKVCMSAAQGPRSWQEDGIPVLRTDKTYTVVYGVHSGTLPSTPRP